MVSKMLPAAAVAGRLGRGWLRRRAAMLDRRTRDLERREGGAPRRKSYTDGAVAACGSPAVLMRHGGSAIAEKLVAVCDTCGFFVFAVIVYRGRCGSAEMLNRGNGLRHVCAFKPCTSNRLTRIVP